jgi:hypothetical protein
LIFRNRIVYYCFLVTVMQSGRLFIPYFLLKDRFNGTHASIMISVAVQIVLGYVMVRSIGKAGNKTIIELLHTHTSKWFARTMLLIGGSAFLLSGAVQISYTVYIASTYVMTGSTEWTLVLLFAIPICWIASIETVSFLYALDILLLLNYPIYLFLLGKLGLDLSHSIDSIIEIGTQAMHLPSPVTIAASAFNLSGFGFLMVFQSLAPEGGKVKYIWTFAVLQMITQTIVFILPTSFFGTEASGYFLDPIMAVADSSHLPYFFIERAIYIMLLVHASVGFIYAAMSWHVSRRMLTAWRNTSPSVQKNSWLWKGLCLGIFSMTAVTLHRLVNTQTKKVMFMSYWFVAFFFILAGFTFLVYWIGRKEA